MTNTPELSPVGMPMFAFGHRFHHAVTLLRSVVASWKPWPPRLQVRAWRASSLPTSPRSLASGHFGIAGRLSCLQGNTGLPFSAYLSAAFRSSDLLGLGVICVETECW